jgi:hypothetical protein
MVASISTPLMPSMVVGICVGSDPSRVAVTVTMPALRLLAASLEAAVWA